MDPPSIIKTFKYNSSQQPMFSVLETPLHYKSFAKINDSSFEGISFSSYLKSKNHSQKSQENAIDDTEISIFDAQKYFSETSDPKDIKMQQKKETISHDVVSVPRISSVSSDGYGRNSRTRSFHATPTASSEASWNSQTGLLVNPPGLIGVSLKNLNHSDHHDGKKRNSVAKKWIFGRKCCCSGENSVQVKEVTSDFEQGGPVIVSENSNNGKVNYMYTKGDSPKAKPPSTILEIHQQKVMAPKSAENHFPVIDPPRQQRVSASGRPFGDGFSFPILNPSTKPPIKEIMNPIEDPPRESLEVFQPIHDRPSISRQHLSSIGRVTNTDDDMGSDASSDLFEIESFSTQTTSYPTYRRRDSLDEAPTFNVRRFAATNGLNLSRSLDEPPTPSVAATECYAPSEVSIDWSVTTAEGFDKASVSNFSISASEIGNATFLRQRMAEEEAAAAAGGGKRKGNGGLLLMSCRQEKAVSVGPQPVKYAPAESPPVMAPVHVGGRPPRANKPPLGSDHSARLSLAFAA